MNLCGCCKQTKNESELIVNNNSRENNMLINKVKSSTNLKEEKDE